MYISNLSDFIAALKQIEKDQICAEEVQAVFVIPQIAGSLLRIANSQEKIAKSLEEIENSLDKMTKTS